MYTWEGIDRPCTSFCPSTLSLLVTLDEWNWHTPQFAYRLTTCGGISLGLFTTVNPNTRDSRRIDTFDTSELVETDRKNGARHCLVAHIVATKSTSDVVTDEAMDYPKDWNSESRSHSTLGHREEGRTICLHSLAVLPDFQGMKVGSTLLKGYCQRIQESGIADRIALIAHDVSPLQKRYDF